MYREDVTTLSERKAKLRFYLPTLNTYDGKSWSWVAWQYVQAFVDGEIPIRLISTTGVDFTNENSEWFTVRELFQTPLPSVLKINLVCGPPATLREYYTENKINIGITAPKPHQPADGDIELMEKYDRIITPSWNILMSFDPGVLHRCKMFCVPPKGYHLQELLKECLKEES